MNRQLRGRAALAITVAFVAYDLLGVAAAAETRKDFQISADIVAGCLVTLAAGGNWGKIGLGSVSGVASGAVEADLVSGASTGLQLECTPGTTIGVTADNGNQPVGGVRQLALTATPSATVPYQLFADGGTTAWTSQSIPISFGAGASKRLLPIRAKATLPGSQRAGTYADTVHVTLAW